MKDNIIMPYCLILWSVLLASTTSYSQISVLTDRQKLQDVEFKAISGLDSNNITISSDKPVILDFGTMYCSPCLESLVKMDSLNNVLGGGVAMYMVTREKNANVQKFKKGNSFISDVNIPIITDDTLLHKIFEHHAQPHLVWIDKSGRAKSSSHYFLNLEDLQRFMKGEALNVVEKNDKRFDYDIGIFGNGKMDSSLNLQDERPRRFVGGFIDGIFPRRVSRVDSSRSVRRYAAYNYPIVKIYAPLFNKTFGLNLFNNQIKTIGIDPERIIVPPNKTDYLRWRKNNSYTYEFELSGKARNVEDDNIALRFFLDQYFGVNVSLKKTKIMGWCIVPSDNTTKDNQREERQSYGRKSGLFGFCKFLNDRILDSHYFYEEGAGSIYQIEFDDDVQEMDVKQLKSFLEIQGYSLEARETIVEQIIFSNSSP